MKRVIIFVIFLSLMLSGCKGALEKVSPQNRQAASVHVERAQGFMSQGKFDEAYKELKEAIKLNPNSAPAYCELGVVYMEKGKFDEAIEPLKKSLKIDAKYPKSNYALAVAYLRKKPADLKNARLYYKKAVEAGYQVPDWFLKYLEKQEKSK